MMTEQLDGKTLVKAGYNQVASDYLALRPKQSADVRLLYEFIQRLPLGVRVLDAGCGAGVPITQHLADHFHVTGVDISEAQIALARQHVPAAQFHCADMTSLAFPDNTFDAICSYYAIIHIPRTEHRALLQNFCRMLQPAGLALLCLGVGDSPDEHGELFGAPMYWSHYDAKTNVHLLTECGFTVIWSKLIADAAWPTASHLFVLARKSQPL